MAESQPVLVADTSTLVNLASPRVDTAIDVPPDEDPLKNVLVRYDVHVPDTVIGELADMGTQDDFLGVVAGLILEVTDELTTHATDDERTIRAALDQTRRPARPDDETDATPDPPAAILDAEYGLDAGELDAIALAHELDADLFATDEIGATTLPTVLLLLDGRSPVTSTPQLIGLLAAVGVLDSELATRLMEYYRAQKHLASGYIDLLIDRYLDE